MRKLKEITVYTDGDSNLISTWSNVPYFFTKTLVEQGIKVNRVNISPSSLLERIIRRIYDRAIKLLDKQTSYNYSRSNIHNLFVRSKIKKAHQKYISADADLFLTFSFSSRGLSRKVIIQFGDWTYDHYLKKLLRRFPDNLEINAIRREADAIRSADLIFPLFPSVAESMQSDFKGKEIYYLGNVINCYDETKSEDLNLKYKNQTLLFIGSEKYMDGAQTLIKAFTNLKRSLPDLKLEIIGISSNCFDTLPQDVFCYGYLDKAIEEDRLKYYMILREATVFVNTTPIWGAFSASIEAMYFFTPVIVTPYSEFTKTFGQNIKFGSYCLKNEIDLIEMNILGILSNPDYKSLCTNARFSVEEFTWSSYVEKARYKIQEKLDSY